MVVSDGGMDVSSGPGATQYFPPGIDEVYEFAMVRLDMAAASRQAWLSRQEARRREQTFLQRILGEEIGTTKRETRLSVLTTILVIGFALLLVWGVSGNNSDESTRGPNCE